MSHVTKQCESATVKYYAILLRMNIFTQPTMVEMTRSDRSGGMGPRKISVLVCYLSLLVVTSDALLLQHNSIINFLFDFTMANRTVMLQEKAHFQYDSKLKLTFTPIVACIYLIICSDATLNGPVLGISLLVYCVTTVIILIRYLFGYLLYDNLNASNHGSNYRFSHCKSRSHNFMIMHRSFHICPNDLNDPCSTE